VLKVRSRFRSEAARHIDANKEFEDRQDASGWRWLIVSLIAFMFLHWLDLPSWR
jgi:hypothetical protein